MKDSRQGQALRRNVVYERNPCDCNCALFEDGPLPGSNAPQFAIRIDDGTANRVQPHSSGSHRDPLGADTTRSKISVSGLTRRRTERQESKKNAEEHGRTQK